MTHLNIRIVPVIALILSLVAISPTKLQAEDAAYTSAVTLLEKATVPSRDGKHHLLLQSLRHLKDPELKPIYDHLASSANPTLNIHGILALAEISSEKAIDFNMLAELSNANVQGEIISNALDAELINDDQLSQLLDWQGLDVGVKLLIMTRKLGLIDEECVKILNDALKSDRLGRRALAAFLLNEIGDNTGRPYLDELDKSDDSQRDPVRAQLLGITLRNQYPGYGEWANRMAHDASIPMKLRSSALIAALRFNLSGAEDAWIDAYDSAEKFSTKLRLAYGALSVSPFTGPRIFQHMANTDNKLVKQIASAGIAVSSKSSTLSDQVIALIDMQHALAISWAQKYARDYATNDDANMILLGIILSFENADQKYKDRRLYDSVAAAQQLFERDAELATSVLSEIIKDPNTDPRLTQAILLGLVRTHSLGISTLINTINQYKSAEAEALALLILARENQPLDRKQIEDLGMIVRGGSTLQESLRIQAAWVYLKYTNQTTKAVQAVLSR